MLIVGRELISYTKNGQEKSFDKYYLEYEHPKVAGMKTCEIADFDGLFDTFGVGDYVTIIRDDNGRLESVVAL